MMCQDKARFKLAIRAAMWEWLDRLADQIDQHYARLGIPKRKLKKRKKSTRCHQKSPETRN